MSKTFEDLVRAAAEGSVSPSERFHSDADVRQLNEKIQRVSQENHAQHQLIIALKRERDLLIRQLGSLRSAAFEPESEVAEAKETEIGAVARIAVDLNEWRKANGIYFSKGLWRELDQKIVLLGGPSLDYWQYCNTGSWKEDGRN